MKTQHTKGDWKAEFLHGRTLVTDDHGCQIASINLNQPKSEANAKLIAAAPELLGVLAAIVESGCFKNGKVLISPTLIAEATRAIKKATQ